MTSRGYVTDLIESIAELVCTCGHIRELLDGEEDAELLELYKRTLKLRREQMEKLLELAEKPDPRYHCIVKHTLGAWWRAIEIYEATGKDEDFQMAKDCGGVAASALSKYLGMEFESCSRCLFDRLLVRQLTES